MDAVNRLIMTKLLVGLAVVAGLMIILVSKTTFTSNGDLLSVLTAVEEQAKTPVSGFSLVDHNGDKITSKMFVGSWAFVFFGYTSCPDVCPATLSQLVVINNMIRSDSNMAGKFKTLFVSVDPYRDSTKYLKEYVKYFNKNFIGVTGEINNLTSFEKQFGAFHNIRDKNKDNYSVAHTSSVFLVNPDGMYMAKFSPPMDVPMIMQQLRMFMQEFVKG